MLEVKRASTVFARYDERTWVRPIDEGNAYPSRPRDELRIALTVQRHRDPWRHRKLNLHPYIPSTVGPHTRLVNTKGVSSKFGKVVRFSHFHFAWLDLSDRKVLIELFDICNSAVIPSFKLFETRTNQTSKCWQGYNLLLWVQTIFIKTPLFHAQWCFRRYSRIYDDIFDYCNWCI